MNDEDTSGGRSGFTPAPSPGMAGAVAGASGAAVGLGFGELAEGAFESIPSLVVAISEVLSDYTPGEVVAFSISNVGSSQKPLVAAGIVIVSMLAAGVLGRSAAAGRRRGALIGFAVAGLLVGWATARNPMSPAVGSWIVGLLATALAAATTLGLVALASRRSQAPVPQPAKPERPPSADPGEPQPVTTAEGAQSAGPPHGVAPARTTPRRAFLTAAAGAGAAALAMVGIGRAVRGQSAAEQFLEANTLRPVTTTTPPAPADPATTSTSPSSAATTATTTPPTSTAAPATEAVQPATESVFDQVAGLDTLDDDVAGISTYLTPNDDFYRIDTAFSVPQVDPANWRLRIGGMVDNPYEITFDEIQAMDLSDHVITLSCVSNRVGGNLVGNAVWTGVPLSVLLDRARVQPGADQVVGRSVDDWTAGFPTPLVFDGRNAVLAIGMNGDFLPTDHGFPARLVVAGLYGYVSAVKWISEIELTTWDGFDAYWVPRGWSKEGPMKTQSRIDVPFGSRGLTAGEPAQIAGIAWAPTRGIERVEVQVDDGDWQGCDLGEALGDESWVQWHREWTPTSGRHRIRVRATDGDGVTQSEREVTPHPNGAEGWHTVTVNITS